MCASNSLLPTLVKRRLALLNWCTTARTLNRSELVRTCRVSATHALLVASVGAVIAFASVSVTAAPVFVAGTGGIAFGVGSWGNPLNPGNPTYLLNNLNGRTDILTNLGIGQTLDLSVPNNTSSTGPGNIPFAAGQFLFLTQFGGGNANGAFGSGAAIITGDKFGFQLADGGIPGGVSASYEILSWEAAFNDPVGTPANTIGTFIAIQGSAPLDQDLAVVSLRTELFGPAIGANKEVPGMVLGIENLPGGVFAPYIIQDLNVPGAVNMPFGGAVIVDNAATGAFRALMYTVFNFAIGAGNFNADITATITADPSSFELFTPDPIADADLINAAFALNNVAMPTDFLVGSTAPVPEPSAVQLALLMVCGLTGWGQVRSRRRNFVSS